MTIHQWRRRRCVTRRIWSLFLFRSGVDGGCQSRAELADISTRAGISPRLYLRVRVLADS